jgi:predicted Zn finger-like uncharacterized protein
MPAIFIECPSCGQEGKISEDLAGRRIKCSRCGTSFTAGEVGSYDVEGASPEAQAPYDDQGQKPWLDQWPEA